MKILLNIRNLLDSVLRRMVKSNFTSRWVILTIDLFLALLSTLFSYFLCLLLYPGLMSPQIGVSKVAIVGLVINLGSFLVFKTYTGIIRYTSSYEVWRVFVAVTISVLLQGLLAGIYNYPLTLLITGLLVNYTSLLIGLIAFRYSIVKIYGRLIIDKGEKLQRAVVFGTTPESVSLARAVTSMRNQSFKLVGFMSYDFQIQQKRIMDLPVIVLNGDFGRLLSGYEIDTIIFPNNKYISQNYDELIRRCISLKIKVLISQDPQDIADFNPNSTKIRNIQIEDLLGRDEIKINNKEISYQTSGKVVLVTGAAGSIGSELVRQLCRYSPKLLILFDSAETPLHQMQLELEDKFKQISFKVILGDVRDVKRVTNVFETYHPQIIYHAAAYKHVPLMEENPCESINVNVFGTKNLANHAVRYRAEKFVMISTDKAVNPSNVMGASKRIAEIYVQSLARFIRHRNIDIKFITTRFGNVLGSNGSVIPRFKQQIEQGGPITVTHPEITRFFMTIPEACRLVLQAGSMGENDEIYVFDMGDPVKIDDMARRMIQLAGYKPDIDIDVVYSGLRPGEKLYEELLNDSEYTKPTNHEKIMIATVREYDFREVNRQVECVIASAEKVDVINTVKQMKLLVPEFISNNSIFENMDNDQKNA